jgi:hypothetical protein
MIQGLLSLAMALGLATLGVRMASNPDDVWYRRAQARGGLTGSEPSPAELRLIRGAGIVTVALGAILAVIAIALMVTISSAQSDIRDLEEQRDRLGALAQDVTSMPGGTAP